MNGTRTKHRGTHESRTLVVVFAAQDYRASRARVARALDAGATVETCDDCGTESAVAEVAHSPKCSNYGAAAETPPVIEKKGREMRGGRWVSTRERNDDGSFTAGELNRRADVKRDAAAMTTRCAVDGCAETFAGTTGEGRAWSAAHRADAHPELSGMRTPRQKPVHRLSGEGGERGRQAFLDARAKLGLGTDGVGRANGRGAGTDGISDRASWDDAPVTSPRPDVAPSEPGSHPEDSP